MFAPAWSCARDALRRAVWLGTYGDISTIAFRVPNLLRALFAEGALSTAFITVFSQKIEKEGDRPAWALASKMMRRFSAEEKARIVGQYKESGLTRVELSRIGGVSLFNLQRWLGKRE